MDGHIGKKLKGGHIVWLRGGSGQWLAGIAASGIDHGADLAGMQYSSVTKGVSQVILDFWNRANLGLDVVKESLR